MYRCEKSLSNFIFSSELSNSIFLVSAIMFKMRKMENTTEFFFVTLQDRKNILCNVSRNSGNKTPTQGIVALRIY